MIWISLCYRLYKFYLEYSLVDVGLVCFRFFVLNLIDVLEIIVEYLVILEVYVCVIEVCIIVSFKVGFIVFGG